MLTIWKQGHGALYCFVCVIASLYQFFHRMSSPDPVATIQTGERETRLPHPVPGGSFDHPWIETRKGRVSKTGTS